MGQGEGRWLREQHNGQQGRRKTGPGDGQPGCRRWVLPLQLVLQSRGTISPLLAPRSRRGGHPHTSSAYRDTDEVAEDHKSALSVIELKPAEEETLPGFAPGAK